MASPTEIILEIFDINREDQLHASVDEALLPNRGPLKTQPLHACIVMLLLIHAGEGVTIQCEP